jgi:hypothetical protein
MFAQGIMNFEKDTHDFGNIDEGTVASYEFVFINTGNQPIEISQVQASCGCTTPDWTRKAIMPKAKGVIKASYNSDGRPGVFNKTITVYSNAQKSMLLLTLKGFVKPRQAFKQEGKNFQKKETNAGIKLAPPAIQLDKTSFDFGKIETGTTVKERFFIHNVGQESLIIEGLESKNPAVSFGLSAVTVNAEGEAILEITIQGDKSRKIEEDFIIKSNDPKQPAKVIRLTAEVYENFSKQLFKKEKTTLKVEAP